MKEEKNTSAVDGIINLLLVTLGLTIVTVIVVVCLPGHGSFMKGLRGGIAGLRSGASLPHPEWSATELRKGRPVVSYDNPSVRRTLNIPWAKL